MGFRFQRRIQLSRGWGINVGTTSGSISHRGRYGSFGSNGFSLRTGIPGLSYRKAWGKNAGGAALVFLAFALVAVALVTLVKVIAYVGPLIWQCAVWVALTCYDMCVYGASSVRAFFSRARSTDGSSV